MIFLNPMALVGVVAVAVVAAAALFRPARQVVVVSSLHLWQRAAESSRAAGRRRRKASLTWWLLLAGALAVVVAIARPVWLTRRPSRHVALTLVPCAELANPPGPQKLAATAARLLRRLDRHDRVSLVLPARQGGALATVSAAEALERVTRTAPLAIQAERLSLSAAEGDVQHVYRVCPATLAAAAGPRTTDLLLATTTPSVTLDAVAAEPMQAGEGQLLVAVKNHQSGAASVVMNVAFDDVPQPPRPLHLQGGQRKAEIVDLLPGVRIVDVSIGSLVGQQARMIGLEHPAVAVAVIGRENQFLRRFLRAAPGVEAVANPQAADVVIAVGADLPAGRPGVAFDPVTAPAGWRLADRPIGPVALADANVLADAPVLQDVNLPGVAVRIATPFVPAGPAEGRRLVSVSGGVLMLADESPKRIIVAFDPGPANSNWGLTPGFPIFLANVLAWLSPNPPGVTWDLSPASVGVVGLLHAGAAEPDTDAAPLPLPQPSADSRELWPHLAGLAGVLWLAGWWRRSASSARPSARVRGRALSAR